MNAVKAWSYSRFSTYDLCPAKLKYKFIDKLPEKPSKALEKGDRVHKAVAAYLLGKGPFTEEAARFRWLYAPAQAFTDKVVEQQRAYTEQWKPTGWFKGDCWVRVVWDLALMYEDATGEVIDHKTGKRYGSNDDQMELFGLSFLCEYPHTTGVTTRLAYLDSGEQEFAEFKRADVAPLQAKWAKKVAPLFADEIFAPRPNDKCRFCSYSKSEGGPCRFG